MLLHVEVLWGAMLKVVAWMRWIRSYAVSWLIERYVGHLIAEHAT